MSSTLRAGIASAFEEDKQALEWISKLVQREQRADFRELSFRTDKSGVLMRRRIQSWAQTGASAPLSPQSAASASDGAVDHHR